MAEARGEVVDNKRPETISIKALQPGQGGRITEGGGRGTYVWKHPGSGTIINVSDLDQSYNDDFEAQVDVISGMIFRITAAD